VRFQNTFTLLALVFLVASLVACSGSSSNRGRASGPSKSAKDSAQGYVEHIKSGDCVQAKRFLLPGQSLTERNTDYWCDKLISMKIDNALETSHSDPTYKEVRFSGELIYKPEYFNGTWHGRRTCSLFIVGLSLAEEKWYIDSSMNGSNCTNN
jgi:hypothetical protein